MAQQVSKSYHLNDPVTQYINDHSITLTEVQKKLMDETMSLPQYGMLGAPEVVQLNQNLMRTIKAKKVLDIGVFTGMSALAAALVLPEDGKIIACDVSEEFTNIAKRYWNEAGVTHLIDLRLQPATLTLEQLLDQGEAETYDFAFIDADKVNYAAYFDLCMKLIRPGGIIVFDNVLWSGKVADPSVNDEDTVGIRKLNDKVAKDDRIFVSMLNVGDGVSLVFKK